LTIVKVKIPHLGACLALVLSFAFAASSASAAGLTGHVNPLAGTRPDSDTFGGGHNFPGATVPFGMVQWGPDTIPSDFNSGGYDYRDEQLKGFGLTHMSGAGCAIYGDFPFLPTTSPIASSPAVADSPRLDTEFQPAFVHSAERAKPGYYSLYLAQLDGSWIRTELTATTRTGLARFTFPANAQSSVLINAGGSAQENDSADVQIDPAANEISGSASSGFFCGQRPRYRVYFSAVFDRPFGSFGTWSRQTLNPGSTSASDSRAVDVLTRDTAQTGAYTTFDTTQNPVVGARVGISFVSVADARANLAAENPGKPFGKIAADADRSWNDALGRIKVSGGPHRNLKTFYTALYHAFMAPRTFNDVNGDYPGMDGRIHHTGTTQYADFSGWDTYRGQIQLLSILMPNRANDMIRSLLADAAQSGCLPRWPYANGQSMTLVGDSADPIIASAAAFGADRFNVRKALAAMVKGATESCRSQNGDYLERQGLAPYLALGYVPYDIDTNVRNSNWVLGSPDAVWGSAATTLEYATDDFAIAQFAARMAGDRPTYRNFMGRSANWRRLYNPATGLIEPRYANGAFPSPYDDLGGAGFAEGDAFQYTWMIPHDPAGLFNLMGGRGQATDRLIYFTRELNGDGDGGHTDHALLGNEPNLNAPWLFDWTQKPFRTQEAIRRALSTLYSATPTGYPGNDDLGTLSSWYVFGALGLYPEVPGVGVLAVSSPLFRRAAIALPHGRRLLITADAFKYVKPRPLRKKKPGKKKPPPPKAVKVPLSTLNAPYIRAMSLNGRAYDRPWTTYCALARGGTISYQLGPSPVRGWGASMADLPPSYGPRRKPPRDSCAP
jgi:predicted alpha-1,2-mannosidase